MNGSASSFADQLKRGVTDGIIGEHEQISVVQHGPIAAPAKETRQEPVADPARNEPRARLSRLEPEAEWLARLEREHREQYLQERHRQQMARLQSRGAALDSPLKVDLNELVSRTPDGVVDARSTAGEQQANASGLYSAAAQAGLTAMNQDPNQQSAKEDFLNHKYGEPGYLASRPTPQSSPFELKRGSVIPATLVTGVNSDLPGRITAQVSQNVYDSATGHHLLVPQGAKLMGRYDSKVSFGQSRVSGRLDRRYLPGRINASNRRNGRHRRCGFRRVQGPGRQTHAANFRLGRAHCPDRSGDGHVAPE